MSRDEITGKILQNRIRDKIQFQTSFTDLVPLVKYCRVIQRKNGIDVNQLSEVLGQERHRLTPRWKGAGSNHIDTHARLSLTQYNLIQCIDNKFVLSDLGHRLLQSYDEENNLIADRESYIKLAFDMICAWEKTDDGFDIHPGRILLNLLLEPALHGYITSFDVAYLFNDGLLKLDSQYSDIVNQVIDFREQGTSYTRDELKKTYTLLTGYVNWNIFNLDEQSDGHFKVVTLQDDFKEYAKKELKKEVAILMSDDELRELVVERDELQEQVSKFKEKYGEEGRVITTLERRAADVQSAFRNRLIHIHGCKCLLCDIENKDMLIAGHIKRDSVCDTVDEKIDTENGFLLCANHDKLFDKYLISFDAITGKIMISNNLTNAEKRICLLDPNYVLPQEMLTPERQTYLIWHNSEFYNKNS